MSDPTNEELDALYEASAPTGCVRDAMRAAFAAGRRAQREDDAARLERVADCMTTDFSAQSARDLRTMAAAIRSGKDR